MDANHLNANPNPKHFSYKVLGLLSWGVLVFCLVSLVVARRLLLDVARVVAIYMMVRFIAFTFFYLAGLLQNQAGGKAGPARSLDRDLPAQTLARHKAVHHLVVLPNFNEPQEVLSRTLQSLSVQERADQSITVVLGMEEREPEARGKAGMLMAQYKGRFFSMMAAFHPSEPARRGCPARE